MTAVEFLESSLMYDSENNVYIIHTGDLERVLNKAKEMEKQQMCQFAFDYQDEFFNNDKVAPIEEFYNETFKSE